MKPKSAVSDGTVGWATFSFPPLPSPLCVSSAATVRVAQTASLLYRRMPSCRTAPWPGRRISTSAQPIGNRRYSRLTICATLNRIQPGGLGDRTGEAKALKARSISIRRMTLVEFGPMPRRQQTVLLLETPLYGLLAQSGTSILRSMISDTGPRRWRLGCLLGLLTWGVAPG